MPKKKPVYKPITLNAEQQAVVNAGEGVWNIQSGPGSGKTACLVARYARLIESGVSPEDILCLTFTNAAAKTMRDRTDLACGVQKMDRVAGFLTFHSLALKFCEQEREHFPFKLAEDFLCLEPMANKFAFEAGRRFEVDAKRLRSYISLQKRSRIRPAEAIKTAEKDGKDEKLALAYKMYDRALREIGVLDFDSCVMEMVELLKDPDVRARWQYKFIQTDESQDMDENQWLLVKAMSDRYGSLLAVGDFGQNLYSFRGSSDLFMDMGRLFNNVQTLFMGHNYRSSPEIVEICRTYGPVPELSQHFTTTNPSGPKPVVTGYPSSADEAEAIVKAVQKMDLKTESCAVIGRTNRCLRSAEDALSSAGVPYHVLGGSGFWQQTETKALIAYLGCVLYPSDHNILTALRSPFHPSKYAKKVEICRVIKQQQAGDPNKPSAYKLLSEYRSSDANQTKAVASFVHFIHTLTRYRGLPPAKVLGSLIQDLRASDAFEDSSDNSPRENIAELIKMAGRYQDIKEFLSYAQRASQASKGKRGVAVSTVHGAKGLEWHTVFLIAVQDGVLPHSKAESMDSERNVLFVGVSRAARDLRISYAGAPSVFLRGLLVQKMDAETVADIDEVFV